MYRPDLESVYLSTMAVMPQVIRRQEKGLNVDLPVARKERDILLRDLDIQEAAWQSGVLTRSPARQERILNWRAEAKVFNESAEELIQGRAILNAGFEAAGKKKRLSPLPMPAKGLKSKARKLLEKAEKEEAANFRSPQQLQRLLYGDLGLPAQVERGGFSITTNVDALLYLIATTNDPALRAILEMRAKHKVAKTFFGEKMLGEATGGKIHFWTNLTRNNEQWKKSGACTGRWATKPSVQVMPEELRHVWIPDQPDHVIVGADLESAEIMFIAYMTGVVTGDWNLWEFVAAGGDIYRRFAAVALGKPESEVTRAERKFYKRCALGTNYGMGEVKGALMWGIPRGEAREVIKTYLRSMWALREFREWATKMGEQNGRLVNPFGRVRYFPDGSFHSECLNFYPQTGVSDIFLRIVRRVEERIAAEDPKFECADQALWMHDAIYISCREDWAPWIGSVLKEEMTREWSPWMPGFRLGTDPKVGGCFREWDKELRPEPGMDLVSMGEAA